MTGTTLCVAGKLNRQVGVLTLSSHTNPTQISESTCGPRKDRLIF